MMKDEIVTLVTGGAGGLTGGGSAVTGVIFGGEITVLSAAGITTGLAALGSLVGGGMLAGVCIVAAAPIAGAAGGVGAYKLLKRLTSK